FITQPQRKCECRRCPPGVLGKVRLPELVGVKDVCAERPANAPGAPTEIVQEICEGGVAFSVHVFIAPHAIDSSTLRGNLAQELYSEPECVAAAQSGLGLLEQQVVGIPKLEQT